MSHHGLDRRRPRRRVQTSLIRGSANEATALTYISTTNDDPTGSPTWSTYPLIDSAEFNCWGARFRTDLWSLESWNIELSQLSAVSEEIA